MTNYYTLPKELERYRGLKDLTKLPKELIRYKCPVCGLFGFTEKICPECGEQHAIIMTCPVDHAHCGHDFTDKVMECPICGQFICSVCGCHDVAVLTRITGYINDVNGFNAGKRQEVRDRHRVSIATGSEKDVVL